jgi:WD40 repeat protein
MFVLGKHPGGLNTNCLAYSPQGRLLASAKDGVKLWDLHDRREVRHLPTIGDASSVAFAPDGRLIVAHGGGNAPVQVLDPASGEVLEQFTCNWCKTQCAFFSAAGRDLVCGGHSHGAGGGKIGRIIRWNLKTGRRRRPLLGPEEDVGFAAFSPDGRRLAAGGDTGGAWVWELSKRQRLATFKCRSGWRVVAYSPDGRTLAITATRNVELYDPETLKRRRVLRGHRSMVWGIAFCPDGRLLSCGGDGTVRLWGPGTFKELACLDWQVGSINNVAVAPDGLTAAAGSSFGDIVIWDLDEV